MSNMKLLIAMALIAFFSVNGQSNDTCLDNTVTVLEEDLSSLFKEEYKMVIFPNSECEF